MMDKYTKITSFDVGTERPTEEYVEALKRENERLERIIQAKIIAMKHNELTTTTIKESHAR